MVADRFNGMLKLDGPLRQLNAVLLPQRFHDYVWRDAAEKLLAVRSQRQPHGNSGELGDKRCLIFDAALAAMLGFLLFRANAGEGFGGHCLGQPPRKEKVSRITWLNIDDRTSVAKPLNRLG